MSYILQRRVGARVMKATIGDCRDLLLAQTREMAKVACGTLQTTHRAN